MTINAPEQRQVRSRAMAAGCGAIALWGALANLSVLAGPAPPFQMVAMTFTLGAAIGILRARRRGVSWLDTVARPAARACLARPVELAEASVASRRRRPLRLSRALLRGPPARAAGRSQPRQ